MGAKPTKQLKIKRQKGVLRKYLSYIWKYARNHKTLFIIAEICIVVSYAVAVLLPLNLQYLTDHIINSSDLADADYSSLWIAIRNYAWLFGIASLFNIIYGFTWQTLSNTYVVDIKQDLFSKVLNAKSSFLSNMNIGDVMSRVDYDSDQLLNLIQRNGMHFINSFIMVISIIAIMSRINITLAVIIILAGLIPIVVTKAFGKIMEKYSEMNRDETGNFTDLVLESLRGFREIKLLGGTGKVKKKIELMLLKLIDYGNRLRWADFGVNKAIYIFNVITTIIVYSYSAHLIYRGTMSVGTFLAVTNYIYLVHRKLNWMYRIYVEWFNRKVSVKRVVELLELECEKKDGEIISSINSIEFRNVNFGYDDQEQTSKKNLVLNNVNLKLQKGESIGIVGESGVGKTTLASLIVGLYECEKGQILINNMDIKEINLSSFRKKIGVVNQDIALFDDTVRNNLCVGTHYEDKDLWNAIDNMRMTNIIKSLPNGLDTRISDSTTSLSGGQMQRLMIARLLLRKPEVIIMDEATSALDHETEVVVTSCIKQYAREQGNVTIISISHRLSTIKNCTRIIVLKNGAVVEEGSHFELVKRNGAYKQLFNGEISEYEKEKCEEIGEEFGCEKSKAYVSTAK